MAADPNFPDVHNLRGLIFMRMNDLAQAEDSFRRAIALNPRDSNALHNFGWLQCQQSRYADALRLFEQAMGNPLYTGRAKTLMAQGICQARAGQTGDAERSLSRSYELDAGNPVTGYNLANLLYQRGDFQRAQFYIRRLNNSIEVQLKTKGMVFNYPDVKTFRDTLSKAGFYKEWRAKFGDEAMAKLEKYSGKLA